MVQLKTLHSFYKRKRDDEQAVVEGEDIFDCPPVLGLPGLELQGQGEQEGTAGGQLGLDSPREEENQQAEVEPAEDAEEVGAGRSEEEEIETNEFVIFRGIEFLEREILRCVHKFGNTQMIREIKSSEHTCIYNVISDVSYISLGFFLKLAPPTFCFTVRHC